MYCKVLRMAEDFTDAKRDDAADLLDVVAQNRRATRSLVKPGVPEVFMLFAPWACGRLLSLPKEHGSTARAMLVLGAVVLLANAAMWVRRRNQAGFEVDNATWFTSGLLLSTSACAGLFLDGDTRQFVLAALFIAACIVIAVMRRSRLMAVVAVVMVLVTSTQNWTLAIATPLWLGGFALGFSIMDNVLGEQS